jgi:hypothetical protein
MSIAKTPDQKEASLANIKIIKARFAQDGQIFKDCIFNNDTMQIVINDERYVGYTYKNLKKYGEEEINKFEDKAAGINLIHIAASQQLDAKDEDEFKNALQSDMLKKYLENNPDEIPKTVGEVITEVNEGAIGGAIEGPRVVDTPRVDEPIYTVRGINEDILEMDEDIPIEKIDGVSEGVRIVNEGLPGLPQPTGKVYYMIPKVDVKKEPFEWNGESGSTKNEVIIENEVKIDDVKPTEMPIIEEKTVVNEINEEKNNNIFVSEIVFDDPDAVPKAHKTMFDVLTKMGKSQRVIDSS